MVWPHQGSSPPCNSSSRSHAFESFLRAARGDHSTSTSEPPSPSDSFKGSILRELFRVVRRSRGIITPEPFPPGNLPGSNLMSGTDPKAGKVTRIVVQTCEDFQVNQLPAPPSLSDQRVGFSFEDSAEVRSQASNTSLDARPADSDGT